MKDKKRYVILGILTAIFMSMAIVFSQQNLGQFDKDCFDRCMKSNAGTLERFTSMFMQTDNTKKCMLMCSQKATPDLCPADYSPVCGFDDKTYSNKCFARMAGVTIKHEGKCKPVEPIEHEGLICCRTILKGSDDVRYEKVPEAICKPALSFKVREIVGDKYCDDDDTEISDEVGCSSDDSMITVTHHSGAEKSFCVETSIAQWIETLDAY